MLAAAAKPQTSIARPVPELMFSAIHSSSLLLRMRWRICRERLVVSVRSHRSRGPSAVRLQRVFSEGEEGRSRVVVVSKIRSIPICI